MQVLTEYQKLEYNSKIIKEQKERGDPITLSGLFQQADTPNGNNRVYPYGILKRETEKYQDLIQNKRSVSTLDHEDSPVIALEKVSHIITELTFDDGTGAVKGRLQVLNTPMGKIVQELLVGGVSLGISSRGVGSLVREGNYEKVDEDFMLIAFDIVSVPSVGNAQLVREAKNRFFTNVNIQYPSSREVSKLFSKEDRLSAVLSQILQKDSK